MFCLLDIMLFSSCTSSSELFTSLPKIYHTDKDTSVGKKGTGKMGTGKMGTEKRARKKGHRKNGHRKKGHTSEKDRYNVTQ